MKKLLFSLIAISLFAFVNATCVGPYTSVKIINNCGYDVKVNIGARDKATAPGTDEYTLLGHEVLDAANSVVNATTVDHAAEYIVSVTVVEINEEMPTTCDRGDVENSADESFEYDNETYLMTFSCSGSQAIYTITQQ